MVFVGVLISVVKYTHDRIIIWGRLKYVYQS